VRVDDPAVLDAELIQVALPLLQLAAFRHTEGHVVQAEPGGLERPAVTDPAGEGVQAEERAADRVHDVPERTGVLVEHRLGADQSGVPGHADGQVGDGDRDVAERGEL
jgi:hypothetical protein